MSFLFKMKEETTLPNLMLSSNDVSSTTDLRHHFQHLLSKLCSSFSESRDKHNIWFNGLLQSNNPGPWPHYVMAACCSSGLLLGSMSRILLEYSNCSNPPWSSSHCTYQHIVIRGMLCTLLHFTTICWNIMASISVVRWPVGKFWVSSQEC